MFEDVLSGDKQWKIVCGDCMDVMAEMDDNSADLILTDPPYGIARVWKGGASCGWASARMQTGRRFIGIEIDPHYCEIAEKRIAEAALQHRMF